MAFDWNDLTVKGARFVSLRTDPRPKLHMVKQREEKIVVPPREERLEQIGDPKAPKMGGITPKKIQVPDVDDLLDKLKKVTAPVVDFSKLENISTPSGWKFSFDMGQEGGDHSHCSANCKCPPCLSGYCSRCTVEALRNEPQDVVRAAVTQYRGVVFQ